MGTYREIKSRSEQCGLCDLLIKSIETMPRERNEQYVEDMEARCRLYWRLDGREHVSPQRDQKMPSDKRTTIKRTRRLAIEWDHCKQKTGEPAYIVLVAPDGQFRADGTFNTQGKSSPSTFFLGRKLTSLTKANTELVQDWLHICQTYHQEACAPKDSNPRFRDLLSETFFAVLNVDQMCLESLPDGERYLALSYTWGKSPELARETRKASSTHRVGKTSVSDAERSQQRTFTWNSSHLSTDGDGNYGEADDDEYYDIDEDVKHQSNDTGAESAIPGRFKTRSENVAQLEKPNGVHEVLHLLPVAIQNAIVLTRKLGYRYIWIDSLCIIQDSQDSWDCNARLMDIIYGNAELTICAADGDGIDKGLEALYLDSSYSQRPAQKQQIIVGYPAKAAGEPPLELMLSWPSESYVACSLWNQRGWTFQERIISHRCLICVNQ
jgi:hypothetical protein